MVGLDAPGGPPPTAVFFQAQTVDALVGAIRAYEAAAHRFDAEALRARARAFDRPVFKARLAAYVDAAWHEFRARLAC
jgi:hypothetical protein